MKKNRLKFVVGACIFTLLAGVAVNQIAYAEKKDAVAKKVTHNINPDDPNSVIYLGSSGVRRSTGDPTKSGFASEAYRIGDGWHPQAVDVSSFPKDKFGLIDWVRMYKENVIKPRGSLDPDFEDYPPMDLNVLFEMKGGFVDNVAFPHAPHTFWLDCINCHDEIFVPMAGANKVSMPEIVKGEWCGRCHGKIAFPIADCTRCHRYPKGHEIEKEDTTSLRTIQ